MPVNSKTTQLLTGVLAGEDKWIAIAIRLVENRESGWDDLMDGVWPHVGTAHRIGVTGPPGAGKSTLTNQLVKHFRSAGLTVGVIAVDPTSALSGGAVFGDRLRMGDVETDAGVFIRSMATRGSLGGLALCAADAADILDAAGKKIIILETVGVGQSELDIMHAADTVLMVTMPGSGDLVQAMKAGVLEIVDIYIVNKADLAGARDAKDDLQSMLQMRGVRSGPQPAVVETVSVSGKGIDLLVDHIRRHEAYLKTSGLLSHKRRKGVEARVRMTVQAELVQRFWSDERCSRLEAFLDSSSGMSPGRIAAALLKQDRSKRTGDL